MNDIIKRVVELFSWKKKTTKKEQKNKDYKSDKEEALEDRIKDISKMVDLKVNDNYIMIKIKEPCEFEQFYNGLQERKLYNLEDRQIDMITDFNPHFIFGTRSSIYCTFRTMARQTMLIFSYENSTFSIATDLPDSYRLIIDERKKTDENTIEETELDIQTGIEYAISRWRHINRSTGNVRFYESSGKGKGIMYIKEDQAKEELNDMLKTLEKTEIGRKYIELVREMVSTIDKRNIKSENDSLFDEQTREQ